MKRLNKLEINPLRLLKENELMRLRGGWACTCLCWANHGGGPFNLGYLVTEGDYCDAACSYAFGSEASGYPVHCDY